MVAGQELTPVPSVWTENPAEHSIQRTLLFINPVLMQFAIPVAVPEQDPSSVGLFVLVVVRIELRHSRQE